MFQRIVTDQRPITTAHLTQTMKLLSMSIDEMKQEIEAELSSNPALEMKEESRCPNCNRLISEGTNCPICSRPLKAANDEPVIFISPKDDFYNYNGSNGEGLYPDEQDISPKVEDLPTYVLRQVALELAVEDRKIAAFMLANLNEDGLLDVRLDEIASYHHVPISRIITIKKLLQNAEPVGVCSANPQEALIVQLENLAETHDVPVLAREIIASEFEFLTKRNYAELARRFKTSVKEIQAIVAFIGDNLNPYPARSHWGDNRVPAEVDVQVYQQPDIIIDHLNDDPKSPLVVEIIMPYCGSLGVNSFFKDAIKSSSKEQKEIWKEDIERASLFVKCLQQRNNTMMRLMKEILNYQKQYILKGPRFLQPLTRVKLSQVLDVHESTISRAVSNKSVQLPNKKIVPMSSFFDRSLNVRTELRDLISREKQPLSDAQLVKLLEEKGHFVARRTVAKYRAMEGILPAHLRRSISQSS